MKRRNAWNNAKESNGPSKIVAGAKFVLALLVLTTLCTCALAQENTTDYWMNKAEELTHNGSIEEAISAYDEALKIEPENTTILTRKASDLNVVGKANESLEIYQKALALLDVELKKDPNDAEAWQKQAGVLRTMNRQEESNQAYEKALEAFNKRTDKDPKDLDAWLKKASVLNILGRWDEAQAAYDKATEISPQNYEAWWQKGQFLSYTGDINESMEAYDRAIELIPINDTALLTVALMDKSEELAAAGRWEDALAAQEKALELDPKNRVGWTFKAFILKSLGRDNETLAAFDDAIEQNPEDVTTWQYKAGQLLEMKRYNESLEAYDRIINLTGENDTSGLAQAYLSKGMALNKTGKQKEAKEALENSLELFNAAIGKNPGDFSLLESKGRALFNMGRYQETIEVYDQILKIAPSIEPYLTQTSTQVGKGDALRALGRNEEALDAYNKAIETGPNWELAWQGRGEAQKAMGQATNASMSFLVADKLGYQG